MKEILIKKYDNRRLYCVEEAKYVSLTEIREFLQRGDSVKVIEKSTGKKAGEKQAEAPSSDSDLPQQSQPEDKKMAEILKRLAELEDKLQLDS